VDEALNATTEKLGNSEFSWDRTWLAVQKVINGDFNGLAELTDLSVVPAAKALGILLAFYFAAKYLSRLVSAPISKRVDETLARFVEKLVYRGMIGAGFVVVLNFFGIESTSFAAVIAAMGFAIGLAFQGTLSNFASGILLMVFRPFKVGDQVVAGGVTARVHEIDLFTTVVDTPDNRRLIIPNSSIASSTIENVTFHPFRRIEVPVGIAYSADMDTTRETLWNAVGALADCIVESEDRKSQVFLVGLGASSVDWIVRVWAPTQDFTTARDRLVYSIKKQLDGRGIEIAFPQLDVHVNHAAMQSSTPVDRAFRQAPRRADNRADNAVDAFPSTLGGEFRKSA
jgi:small conductance mechanosensitive channel